MGETETSKSRRKKSVFPRMGFWEDHHTELTMIVREEMTAHSGPVKRYPSKRRKDDGHND